MSEWVTDVLVMQDGYNPSFFSYMACEEAQRIQECGLANAGQIWLKEVDERPIPKCLKKGESEITDILVKLQPNVPIYLN